MNNEDDLGGWLRSEIPSPRPGYFEQLEARMGEIDAELEEPVPVEPANPELSSVNTQTDDNVIRLNDMRHPETFPRHRRRIAPILAAAAVVAIAATAGIIALNRDNAVVQLDAADSAPDQTGTAPGTEGDEVVVPALEVAEGSVWVTNTSEPIRALLSPAGAPAESQFSIHPLVATGRQAEAENRVWVEMRAFREQPETWYPADLLEKVADPLPNTEPTSTVYAGTEPLEPDLTPGSIFGVTETVQPGDVLASTGIRVQANDVAWVLIDAEIPFWIADESVIDIGEDGIEGFDRRQCFGDAESLLILDFSADALSFTARFDYLNSVLLASGSRLNTADPMFTVVTSAVGSGEEVPGGIIENEQWEGTDGGIIAGDRGQLPLVACETVADETAALEEFIPDEMLLPIPG